MSLLKPSDIFKTGANWVSGDVRAYMTDQVGIFVDSLDDVRNNNLERIRYVYVLEIGALYRLNLSSGAEDDGNANIRDNQGRVYQRTTAFDPASRAEEEADRAEQEADRAEGEADRAELARDTAFVNADVYTDVATGRAAVADGEQFAVVSADGAEVIRYRRDSSSAQTEVARFPSAYAVQSMSPDVLPKVVVENAFFGAVFADAVFITAGDVYDGITIPATKTGFQTYIQATFNFDRPRARSLIGKKLRFVTEHETSANALAQRGWGTTTQVQRHTGTSNPLNDFTNVSARQISGTRALFCADYEFMGEEAIIRINARQLSNNAGTGAECSIKPISAYWMLLDADGFADAVHTVQLSAPVNIRGSAIKVKPDGTGDYTTLKAALAAEGGGVSNLRRMRYEVFEGVYTDISHNVPAYVDIVGVGRNGLIRFEGAQAADASLTDITDNSTFDLHFTVRLENIYATCKNMRYVVHTDAPQLSAFLPALQEVYDCYFEHLGNQEARDYQTSIGGNPNGVFTAEQAWGCGTHSGERIFAKRSTFVTNRSGAPAFGYHTNKDFALPDYVELEQCRIINRAGGDALGVNSYGTGLRGTFVIKNCEVQGILWSMSGTRLSTALSNQPGDRTSEVGIYISGCSPFAWTSDNTANVLQLISAVGAASAVEVGGDGAEALFGAFPVYRKGGTNFAARVWSDHAINGPAGTGLGARLGDCTSENKTLTVTFDGGSEIELSLDQNYTSMNNAAVISALNGLLTAEGVTGGRVFSEINAYDNEAPVFQLDREVHVKNTSTDTVILKGMAVAYDGTAHLGRIATNADARKVIAGIALENIAPGDTGRVQKSGHIAQAQILFSGTPSIVFGDEFGVSASAGMLVEGEAVPVLRSIGGTVLEFVH